MPANQTTPAWVTWNLERTLDGAIATAGRMGCIIVLSERKLRLVGCDDAALRRLSKRLEIAV